MTKRWPVIKDIVGRCLEQRPSVRHEVAHGLCANDTSLLSAVISLLGVADRTEGALDLPALAALTTSQTVDDLVERVIGPYTVLRRLALGGMGEVFEAVDTRSGVHVALKIVRKTLSPSLRSRLERESSVYRRLRHPALCRFLEAVHMEDCWAFAMEFIDGDTVRTRLAKGSIPRQTSVTIVREALAGLAHVHSHGILHRDIKPENIMLRSTGGAVLLDFGLAKALDAYHPDGSNLTAHGQVVGTPGYLSPEQVLGEPLSLQSDLFQVGAVLYEMLAGEPAFPGATPMDRFGAVMRGTPTLDPIPRALRPVLERALAPRHEDRFSAAVEFALALADG